MWEDLAPYVCLFLECANDKVEFSSFPEWLQHTKSKHWQPSWVCSQCTADSEAYDCEGDLLDHIKAEHNNSQSDQEAAIVARYSRRDTLLDACPICGASHGIGEAALQDLPVSSAVRQSNVLACIANHLETMALASLPWHTCDADDAASNEAEAQLSEAVAEPTPKNIGDADADAAGESDEQGSPIASLAVITQNFTYQSASDGRARLRQWQMGQALTPESITSGSHDPTLDAADQSSNVEDASDQGAAEAAPVPFVTERQGSIPRGERPSGSTGKDNALTLDSSAPSSTKPFDQSTDISIDPKDDTASSSHPSPDFHPLAPTNSRASVASRSTSSESLNPFEDPKYSGSGPSQIAAHRLSEQSRLRLLQQLKGNVGDWKTDKLEDFGELLMYDKLDISKAGETGWRLYHVYLFEVILLCCKQVTPIRARSRFDLRRLVGRPQKSEKPDPPELQIKGRIHMMNITDVKTDVRPGKSVLNFDAALATASLHMWSEHELKFAFQALSMATAVVSFGKLKQT